MKRIAVLGTILFFSAVLLQTMSRTTRVSAAGLWPWSSSTPMPTSTSIYPPTRTLAPTNDPALMAEVTLLFQRATDTQVAIQKTESAIAAAQQTQAIEQYLYSVGATNAAAATLTQAALYGTGTAAASTAIAAQTYGMQTAMATHTSGASTVIAQATSTSLAMTQTIEKDKLNAARFGVWSMYFFLIILGALVLGFAAVKVWGALKYEQAKNLQRKLVEPDQHGRYPLIPEEALGKSRKLVNGNLAHRAVTDIDKDDLSTEQALLNTASHRQLEATRALAESPAFARQMLKPAKQLPAESEATMPPANVDISKPGVNYLTEGSILTPAWSIFESWDGTGGIPYGISARGMERVQIQQVPHGGIFGQTGKGKSRYFLRPFIAGAIASGQRVVILGKQADFWPFAEHANVKMIPIRNMTDEQDAAQYAGYLRRIVEEMNRRDSYLTANRVSTWDRAGRENTLLILDELGNALDMMPREIAQEAHRWVQGLVKEGRKAGFNVWLASQRAVGFKSVVEQLGRAVFYLADADASRHALGFPGAETLPDGQFIAKFHNGVNKCAAFDPTDEELVKFLQGRQVKVHEPITWLEGTVIEEAEDKADEDVDARIKRLYQEMKAVDRVSLSQIQRQVYGDVNTGGAHFRHIQDVIAQLTATTTGNQPHMGASSSSATPATA
jgi:hypothetical protein